MYDDLLKQANDLIIRIEQLGQKVPRKLRYLPNIVNSAIMIGWMDLAKKYAEQLKEELAQRQVKEQSLNDLLKIRLNQL